MSIHLARNGSALGIYSEAEVRAGLETGRFQHTDLGWREGMPSWVALSSWPEFAASASVAIPVAGADAAPSELPWETAPGPGSLLRSAWLMISRPAVLAHARLTAGTTFGGAYLAMAILLVPMLLLSPLNNAAEQARTAYICEWMQASDNAQIADLGREIAEKAQAEASGGVFLAACGVACLMVVYPLFAGLMGILLWPGLRLQGRKVGFGRAITGSILVHCLLFLGLFPLSIALSVAGYFAPVATMLPTVALALLNFGLGCRALGAALGCSGWRVFLSWLLMGVLFCLTCCCCGWLAAFLGMAASGR